MKIAESAVRLNATHTEIKKDEKKESLTVWGPGGSRQARTQEGGSGHDLEAAARKEIASGIRVSLSQQSRRLLEKGKEAGEKGENLPRGEEELGDDLKLMILKALFEKLYGRKIHLDDPKRISEEIGTAEQEAQSAQPQGGEPGAVQDSGQAEGWGVIYEAREIHYEYESFSFSAAGSVTTEDGNRIEFSLALSASRESYSSATMSLRAGDALRDPLVINLDRSTVGLGTDTFFFDLDGDGREEEIAALSPGSGFLALDRNGDGMIADGTELFGTVSGDGFGDLAVFDQDANGWIDENDPVYSRLAIWAPGTGEGGRLTGLAEAGVGALSLSRVSTPFDLKGEDGGLLGKVRSSGFFLRENGQAGSMQQVDLVA